VDPATLVQAVTVCACAGRIGSCAIPSATINPISNPLTRFLFRSERRRANSRSVIHAEKILLPIVVVVRLRLIDYLFAVLRRVHYKIICEGIPYAPENTT
jgi:hypothetical protein